MTPQEEHEEDQLEAAARLARRPWPATPIRSQIDVSFEFFPAATPEADERLWDCIEQMAPVAPSFVSMTYGAGGSTQDRTLNAVDRLTGTHDLPTAGHLTCVGATADRVHGVIDRYVAAGVDGIVALRGDAPADGPAIVAGGYGSAVELVEAIRARPDTGDLTISVAAYPETHPKAVSPQADLDNLKAKLDAGADQALTQFFFDTDAFLRFLERARKAGITAPIIPGIMPVTNFARVSNFAARCGTVIPDWMPDLFGGLDDAPEVRHLVAATVAAEQCRLLVEHGVTQFHFYTMNKPELTLATCRILGVKPVDSDSVSKAG